MMVGELIGGRYELEELAGTGGMSSVYRAKDMLLEHREALTTISELLLTRETIEREQFVALLEGKSEEEVFGSEAPPAPGTPERPELPGAATPAPPRPLPRPGLAGGTAEARGLDRPERPDFA